MPTPYSKVIELVLNASETFRCYKLPFPYRGRLTRFIATQESGTYEGFIMQLFDSKIAAPDGFASDDENRSMSSSAGGSEPSPALYQILPDQEAHSGVGFVDSGAIDVSYCTKDGGPCSKDQEGIYLRINANGGAGGKTFKLALTVLPPDF